MSVALMSSVWALDLPSSEKFVLLALADNANDDGTCWPSVAVLCSKTSLAERTVRAVIHRLQKLGLLVISERYGRSNVFTVTPASAAPLQSLHPAPDAPPPLQPMQGTPASAAPTPASAAPRIIKEPSIEPSSESSQEGSSRAKRSTATRLPSTFELTEDRRAYAAEQGLDPQRTLEDFRDYWTSASGANARKHDWDAAWRMWCRRQMNFKPNSRGAPVTRVKAKTIAELEAEELARVQH